MATLAIIGGSGLARMEGLNITRREMVKTPFGAPSCPLIFGEYAGVDVVFLARHGNTHRFPPHRINYCANIWALHSVGIERIIAIGAVGGIADDCSVGKLVIPDQIIDYTVGRQNTFFDGGSEAVKHIDFSYPYDDTLRKALIEGAEKTEGVALRRDGTLGVTQGPRLETAAEIARLQRDGCSLVGMTAMPETALAREMDMAYAACLVVVSRAAGIDGNTVNTDVLPQAINDAMISARSVLQKTLPLLA